MHKATYVDNLFLAVSYIYIMLVSNFQVKYTINVENIHASTTETNQEYPSHTLYAI